MTKKDPTTNKALIEEFTKHSREYHNPREDITRRSANGDGAYEVLMVVMVKLDTMDNRLTKMDKSINVVHNRYEACGGPHPTRDCEY